MPTVNNFGFSLCAGARSHGERDAPVIQSDERLRILIADGQDIAPTPQIVRFPLYKLLGGLPRLAAELCLLIADQPSLEIA
jgi:hypothetical protein